LRRVLIISPYFPPTNAADMQRVRMSLPYFEEFGWNAEVVTVDAKYSDLGKDDLLSETVSAKVKVHKVKALSKRYTSKIGLGSIALRSLYFYRKTVNRLLKTGNYDLIYFPTTQFPVCVLGNYWKQRFGVPYVIDMQDPWYSEYYLDKPKNERPPKYWFAHRLNKWLEPKAMKSVDGLISVSQNYIDVLKARYPAIAHIPEATITFGSFDEDLKIAARHQRDFSPLLDPSFVNIVYIGRGGFDMHDAIGVVFGAFKKGLKQDKSFEQIRFCFIGTSYAAAGTGKATVLPLAEKYDLSSYVMETTDRISFFHALHTLQQADALFIPGSNDAGYTASKIYPYLSTQKPLLAVFNRNSSAISILKEFGAKYVYNYDDVTPEEVIGYLEGVLNKNNPTQTYNPEAIEKYSARQMTLAQCMLFDKVIDGKA